MTAASIRSLRTSTAAAFAIISTAAGCVTSSSVPAGSPVPTAAPAPAPAGADEVCCSAAGVANGLRIAERYRVGAIVTRRFTHEAFWRAVEPSISSPALRTEEIGRSLLGREIRAVTFGEGPTTVLLWSQMHGDESTATMALADVFNFLAQAAGAPLRERLRRQLTIVFVPMLNPDGAELFQRENAAGIDVNRDARRLVTPEARALRAIRDRIRPQFGFNLHDQGARTLAGARGKQAAIALLPPPYSADRSYNEVRSRARLVAAAVAWTLSSEIPGRIARYDDTFNPRAFGDLIQQLGTSTILIESGALPDDPEKQRLRAVTAAAILGALDAIATGRYAAADPNAYEALPFNESGAVDLLVRGGQLVLPGKAPMSADVAINYDDALARTGARVRDVGDLQEVIAIDTVDATGLFLHPLPTSITTAGGNPWLRIGAEAALELRRGAARTSELVRTIGGRG